MTKTLRATLNALATAAPEWLRAEADPAWLERYDRRAGDQEVPQGEAKRRAHAEQIGRDGHQLLAAIMARMIRSERTGSSSWTSTIMLGG
jgi:hypothetical protein